METRQSAPAGAWRHARAIVLLPGMIAVALFARVGEGTLAPWDPTRRLVVESPYRRVRNPMISAVLAVLTGEALVLGSPGS